MIDKWHIINLKTIIVQMLNHVICCIFLCESIQNLLKKWKFIAFLLLAVFLRINLIFSRGFEWIHHSLSIVPLI